MARTLTAAALLAFAPLWAQPSGKPGRRDLARYVYPVKVHEGPAGRGAFHLGGGFFLSSDGDFLTVSHLFQNLRPPVSVAIAVDDRGAVAECPVESVAAFSRDLDFVIMRVNLGRSKARVPPIARSATVGEKVFGFIVQVSGPVGPSAGPQAKAGILPTEAIVSAVSPRRMQPEASASSRRGRAALRFSTQPDRPLESRRASQTGGRRSPGGSMSACP